LTGSKFQIYNAPWCQFHQHSTLTFLVPKFFAQLFSNYSLALKLFSSKEIGKKAACKMLMKLTTGSDMCQTHVATLIQVSNDKICCKFASSRFRSEQAQLFFFVFILMQP